MPRISHSELMLMEALNDLEKDWQIARMDWRDQAREKFEKDFLEELMPAVRIAAGAIQELSMLMKQVVRQCG